MIKKVVIAIGLSNVAAMKIIMVLGVRRNVAANVANAEMVRNPVSCCFHTNKNISRSIES